MIAILALTIATIALKTAPAAPETERALEKTDDSV